MSNIRDRMTTTFKSLKSPWRKSTTKAIVLFLLAFVVLGSIVMNNAESKEKDTTMIDLSYGLTYVGGDPYDSETIAFVHNFNSQWEIGLALQLRLDCPANDVCDKGNSSSPNQSLFGQRVFRYHDFQMGIGISYDHNQSPAYNTNTPFVLSMRYYFNNYLALGYWHKSCGGICSSNSGEDRLSIVYSL